MTLRTRLLAATAAVAVLVLLIFGIVAYRIAQDATLRQELAMIQDMVQRMAAHLDTVNPALLPYELALAANLYTVVQLDGVDGEPVLRYAQPDPQAQALDQALADARQGGAAQLQIEDTRYLWAEAPLTTRAQRLVLVQRASGVAPPVLQSLGAKLAATGIVVIWVAVWAGLIVSSTLARRLDAHNEQLLHQALHDGLTGLPNRRLLQERVGSTLALAARETRPQSLLIMDLDRFKEVNDTLGHPSGDELLKQVAARLRAVLRGSDTAARLGGDEFAILLPNTGAAGAMHCAAKIAEALRPPFCVRGVELESKTSIGIAVYPEHGSDVDTLVKHADVAMYEAKRAKCGYAVYSPETDPHSVDRLTLLGDLRAALVTDQLELHYQPKLDLQARRIAGVEALVRWRHPHHGLIPPDDFIQLAEQNGLIDALTDWVLRAAIRQGAAWRERGIELGIAINLSPYNLLDLSLPTRIAAWLEEARLPPRTLQVELTESAAMADIERAVGIFQQLSRMGVRLAIDDFGTGMSSLAYLKRLPVSDIKIDRSFVTDMAEDENNAVIVRAIIDLSHNLGCHVVAEGIEDEETLQLLAILGCDSAQGYHIARPAPAAAIEDLLSAASTPHDGVCLLAGEPRLASAPR